MKNWVALGAPREKMNVGLAFYGRSFRGATELGAPHGGADDSSWTLDEGSPQYFVSFGTGGGGRNKHDDIVARRGVPFLSGFLISPLCPSYSCSRPFVVVLFTLSRFTSSLPPEEYHRKDRRDDRCVGRRNVYPDRVFRRW